MSSRFEIPIGEAREIFSKRGCTLLSKKCPNQTTILKYICACGKNAESSVRNFKKRKTPCVGCNMPDIETLKKIFEDRGCKLLSTKCTYASDLLEYICACKRKVTDSYQKFQAREKPCSKCNLPSVEEVKQIFINLEVTPLFDTFDNMKQKLKYICKCGEERFTVYDRIIKGQLCKKCGDKSKAFTYEQVKDYFEKHGCKLLSTEYTNSYSTLLYMCSCKNKNPSRTTFNRFRQGHRCIRCGNIKADLEEAEKLMDEKNCKLITTYETYNDGNLEYKCHCNKISTVKYKQFMATHQTWKGCNDCYIQSMRKSYNDVYDLFEEKGLVLLEKNYTDRCQKLSCICSCKRIANLSYSEVLRGRLCMGCASERREQTNLETYGVKNPFQSEEIKIKMRETMLERYGYEHNFQNPNILMQAINSSYRIKEYNAPNGTVFSVQGYEPFALDYIIKDLGINENDIITDCSKMPTFYYYDPVKKTERRYYPDIYIEKDNVIIEVKSRFTYEEHKETNIAKFKAVMKAGYNMEIYIFNRNGELEEAWSNCCEESN